MFGIASSEYLVILIVAILVLGPEHLPRIMRTVGKFMSDFRRISTEFQRVINLESFDTETMGTSNKAKVKSTVKKKTSTKKKKNSASVTKSTSQEASKDSSLHTPQPDSSNIIQSVTDSGSVQQNLNSFQQKDEVANTTPNSEKDNVQDYSELHKTKNHKQPLIHEPNEAPLVLSTVKEAKVNAPVDKKETPSGVAS